MLCFSAPSNHILLLLFCVWWNVELFALLHTWIWIYSYPVWLSFIQYRSWIKRIEALIRLMKWRSSSATVGLHEINFETSRVPIGCSCNQSLSDSRFSLAYHASLHSCWVKVKNITYLQRTSNTNEVRCRCLYIFSLSAKVLLWFHIKAENRRPKVTVSHLPDQHVIAVYWLWKSSEGQVQSTVSE